MGGTVGTGRGRQQVEEHGNRALFRVKSRLTCQEQPTVAAH